MSAFPYLSDFTLYIKFTEYSRDKPSTVNAVSVVRRKVPVLGMYEVKLRHAFTYPFVKDTSEMSFLILLLMFAVCGHRRLYSSELGPHHFLDQGCVLKTSLELEDSLYNITA